MLSTPIHFAKIEFTETIGYGNPDSVITLNRDEVQLDFCGTTASYIPMIQWRMSYFYDEAYIWPM